MKHPMPDSLKQYINNSYKNLIVLTLLVTEAIFQCKEIYKAICDVSLGYGKYITSLNSHWWLCQGLTATSPALGSCPHTEWLGLQAALRPVVFYIFDLVDKVQRDVRVQVDEGNLCVVDLAAPEWNTLHTNKKIFIYEKCDINYGWDLISCWSQFTLKSAQWPGLCQKWFEPAPWCSDLSSVQVPQLTNGGWQQSSSTQCSYLQH